MRKGKEEVDLLIGIDHAHMDTGENKQAGHLAVRHTPSGWVVFGGSPGHVEESSRILHVKFEMPVDLTDFWKTETMGAVVKPCACEADKLRTQVKKALKHRVGKLVLYSLERAPEPASRQ